MILRSPVRHPREGGGPAFFLAGPGQTSGIPAFGGMTGIAE